MKEPEFKILPMSLKPHECRGIWDLSMEKYITKTPRMEWLPGLWTSWSSFQELYLYLKIEHSVKRGSYDSSQPEIICEPNF